MQHCSPDLVEGPAFLHLRVEKSAPTGSARTEEKVLPWLIALKPSLPSSASPSPHPQRRSHPMCRRSRLAYGQEAALRCALMLVAQVKAALGGLHRIERVVKLGVYVNSAPGFTDQPKVANGASDLMFALFGDAGRHARSAVGVAALPLGAAVEVDAIIQIATN